MEDKEKDLVSRLEGVDGMMIDPDVLAEYRMDKIEQDLWLYGVCSAIRYDVDLDGYRRDGMMFEDS